MSVVRRRTGPIMDRGTIRERLARAATLIGQEPRPTPEEARAVLEQRARALARVPALPPPAAQVLDVVTFSLANLDYAIELGIVHKIVPLTELTPIPGAPDFFVGVINVRGEILPIVDLHRLYGMARSGWTDQSWAIVLGGERHEFALLADKVHEATTLGTDQVLDWQGSATGVGRQSVRGMTEGALIVLDGAALLEDDRLVIDQVDGAGA
jgi:purine-binding chemotaxis protein CheW